MSEEHGIAHHGAPILTARDVDLCLAMAMWINIARKKYGNDWLPCSPDIIKSRLFWRCRAGIKPLPSPPPTAYSCPWYEVVEEDRPHSCYEDEWEMDGACFIAQCPYQILERGEDCKASRVQFGPWTFRVWRGEELLAGEMRMRSWIQRETGPA